MYVSPRLPTATLDGPLHHLRFVTYSASPRHRASSFLSPHPLQRLCRGCVGWRQCLEQDPAKSHCWHEKQQQQQQQLNDVCCGLLAMPCPGTNLLLSLRVLQWSESEFVLQEQIVIHSASEVVDAISKGLEHLSIAVPQRGKVQWSAAWTASTG